MATAVQVLESAMGHDPLDAYSRQLTLASEAYPASFKFGVPDQLEFFGDTLAEAAYQAAVQRLQDMGGTGPTGLRTLQASRTTALRQCAGG